MSCAALLLSAPPAARSTQQPHSGRAHAHLADTPMTRVVRLCPRSQVEARREIAVLNTHVKQLVGSLEPFPRLNSHAPINYRSAHPAAFMSPSDLRTSRVG